MASSVLYLFENSGSFAIAKSNMALVESIEYWDKNLIERLVAARQNNSQIEHSFGVKSRIESIVKRFENETIV
jgi:hypothetical protein